MERKRRRKGGTPLPATEATSDWRDFALAGGVALATASCFWGVLGHAFLNWDDPDVLVNNAALGNEGVVAWALETRHMGHYQPLSWLAWWLLREAGGPSPALHHGASLVLHAANAALLFCLARRLSAGLGPAASRVAASAAGLVFALHPLRVEAVAWASAMPYALATVPLLVSFLCYWRHAAGSARGAWWLGAAVAAYVVSLLARPLAPGMPLVLLLFDAWLGRLGAGWRGALLEKLPFAFAAAAFSWLEATARTFAPLARVDTWSRLQDAALAPFFYLGKSLWPAGLTPLDPMPLSSRASPALALAAIGMLAAATALLLVLHKRWPSLAAAWLAYLALLAPASGLAPSGLQATADRYGYVPGLVLACLAGGALGTAWRIGRWRAGLVALIAILALGMGAASRSYLAHWRDSVSLWTRALAGDERNDVALYNLGLALEAAGDERGAERSYDALLSLIPDHAQGKHNRDRLAARRLEGEAGALAESGRLAEAVAAYGRALELDPERLHARRSRGMALAQLGRFEEAIPDLTEAVKAGPHEAAVAAALSFALERTGRKAVAGAAGRK